MTSRFTIEEVGPESALKVWETSPHSSVFTHPRVASTLSSSVCWYAAIKGSEIFVIWPVSFNKEAEMSLPPFSYYFGPFWSSVAVSRSVTSTLSDRLDAYEGLTTEILQRFGSIRAELHPNLLDVRAFSWWNYDDPTKPKFTIEPRYSAQLLSLQESDSNHLLSNIRELRRRELRRIDRSDSLRLCDDPCLSQVEHLYRLTFERQGNLVSNVDLEAISRLFQLVDEGFGRILAVSRNDSSEIGAVVLCLEAQGTTNMVLNLTHPSERQSGLGSWTVFKSILLSKEAGNSSFDFNGANSPKRGDDKHSFGAREVLYFCLGHDEHL